MISRPTHYNSRYKHDLSPRQREVLALVTAGRTNAEIADALGISLDGAKWHVREILSKLGCESREEAAAWWRQYNRPLSRLGRGMHALLALGPVKLGGAAITGVAAVGVAVAGVIILTSGGGDTPSTGAGADLARCSSADIAVELGAEVIAVPAGVPGASPGATDVAITIGVTPLPGVECHLEADLALSLWDARQDTQLPVDGAPLLAAIDEPLPQRDPASSSTGVVRIATWADWCGEARDAVAAATILGLRNTVDLASVPACYAPGHPRPALAWVATGARATPPPAATGTPAATRTYTVAPGDTLPGIARAFGVSIEALLAANPGLDPLALQVGQVLLLPAPGDGGSASAVFCDPAAVAFSLRERETQGTVVLDIDAAPPAPCLLDEPLEVRLVDGAGTLVNAITNPVTIKTGLLLPDNPVATLEWFAWCEEGTGFRLELAVGGAQSALPIAGTPACPDDVEVTSSRLQLLARGDRPPAPTVPAPLPAGFRLVSPPGPMVEVQVYAGLSLPAGQPCVDILDRMVPSSAAGTVGSDSVTCELVEAERLTFAEDGQGRVFLHRIELLLLASYTVPQPYDYSDCNEIRAHLVPANGPEPDAAYVLVCGVEPLAPGEQGNPLRIWARLPADAIETVTIGPDQRCWELSRYLGPARGATTVPVACIIE